MTNSIPIASNILLNEDIYVQRVHSNSVAYFEKTTEINLEIDRCSGYPVFAFQEEEDLPKYRIQEAMHIACARTKTLMTGCKIVHKVLVNI